MASGSSHHLLFLSLLLLLFTIGAHARPGVHFHPCKTLFISSFTVFTFKPTQFENPNFPNQNPTDFFTEFNRFNPHHHHHQHQLQPQLQEQPFEIFVQRRPDLEFSNRIQRFQNHNHKSFDESFGVSSLRERTKDILSVVTALLFGAGCGALTAATMYLAWSLITNRYESVRSEESDGDDDRDFEYESPKKMGYAKISSAPAPVPVAQVPEPKEVVQGGN